MACFNHFLIEIYIFTNYFLLKAKGEKLNMNIIHLWAIAFISYGVSILFAFFQEPIGVIGFTILTLILLVSTKWAKIKD